ncbi:MAG: DUF3795 domain-containing protein [Ignavibacteriales bacterium]
MEYSEILERLSPCGLDCIRCTAYEDGEIKQTSTKLLELLGGFNRMAKIRADFHPVFNGYSEFEAILTLFSKGNCGGCRSVNINCPIDCPIKDCYRGKQVDFCFQCSEYPCEAGLRSFIGERWKLRNDRMKEIGVVSFFEEGLKVPRY